MALSYLIVYRTDEVPDELAEMEAEGEDLDLEKAKQQAQVIYEKLPAHLREHVGTGWFRERVSAFDVLPVCFLHRDLDRLKLFAVQRRHESHSFPANSQRGRSVSRIHIPSNQLRSVRPEI